MGGMVVNNNVSRNNLKTNIEKLKKMVDRQNERLLSVFDGKCEIEDVSSFLAGEYGKVMKIKLNKT